MPGTVYTVASGKGGVGKTTTSVNLAVALWREGNAVALVDADIGMANLAAVLDLEPEETLHDVLAGRASVGEAVVEAKDGDLLVLPGSRELESFADADPTRLRAVVDDLVDRADYVIIDTGAGLSYEDVLPLGMADGVVLVTTPDPAAFGDTTKTMEIADLLGAPIRGLVVTRAVKDTDAEAIAGEIGAELLGAIPEDPAVMASTVAGDPLESYAPDADAAAAYRDLASTILEGDEAWAAAHATAAADEGAGDDGVTMADVEEAAAAAVGSTAAGSDDADPDDSAGNSALGDSAAEADDPAEAPVATDDGVATDDEATQDAENGASTADDEAASDDDPEGDDANEPGDEEGGVAPDDGEADGAPDEAEPGDEAESADEAVEPVPTDGVDEAATDDGAGEDEGDADADAADVGDDEHGEAEGDASDDASERGSKEAKRGGVLGWFGRLFS